MREPEWCELLIDNLSKGVVSRIQFPTKMPLCMGGVVFGDTVCDINCVLKGIVFVDTAWRVRLFAYFV